MPDEKSMIEDLRELETELRDKGEYRKANIIDLFIIHSTHCKILKSVIQDKIEDLGNMTLITVRQREEVSYAMGVLKELLNKGE